ncbi:hypothetical protein HYQ45_005548 [Verticillium longisporum]|uniref:Uncharacterized protein n=1 Tax=Verticillium longisporum TaxID=100787 RepID=A0A8I3AWS6_VERLO|nr:hypothetical protein HYQ45_005548 [Verticillium longisporum]
MLLWSTPPSGTSNIAWQDLLSASTHPRTPTGHPPGNLEVLHSRASFLVRSTLSTQGIARQTEQKAESRGSAC